tara:strand:+ start:777 stop:1385 length:609 start_codon:yes stop_codon:yes gene_type:complete
MLGLGNSLTQGGIQIGLLHTYTSDFSGGAGDDSSDWEAFSVQNSASDLTLATNQTAPGSGEAGWLKGTFAVTQTDSNGAGIKNTNFFAPASGLALSSGGYHEITFKLYLDNPGGSIGDYWGGTDEVRTYCVLNNIGINDDGAGDDPGVPQHQVATFGPSISNQFSVSQTTDTAKIYWAQLGDRPAANAVFYIKDIVWKVYGY